MKHLIAQIAKFGVVGMIAFVIDYGILIALVRFLRMNNVLAATISFTIALIFNYLASMKYVFRHREDMARWMEMAIFAVSSVVGLLINDLIIWMSTSTLPADAIDAQHDRYTLYTTIGKLVATVVVAVWNFGIRKWLLDDTPASRSNVLVHHLGVWSLRHAPFGWQ